MDITGHHGVGSSLMKTGSGIWRNTTLDELFSNSIREVDDEEALKWAALERLPTYSRLKKGLLVDEKGAATEVEIGLLGNQEKKNLIERLLKVSEEDNEKFLMKLRRRIDRVGIEIPKIEVRFEHLTINARAYAGSRAVPTVINFCLDIVEVFLNCLRLLPSRHNQLCILHDVTGIIKPCRMTLLLAPPSSGKTSLLRALDGKLGSNLEVSGRVSYNGHDMHEFVPQRSAAYISQHDAHIGEMTVRETLTFSARCQGVGAAYDLLVELARREKAANIKPDPDIDMYMKSAATKGQEASIVVDYILKVMGLEGCADTIVGNQMLRGISGGQRKRVTTGEMLVGPTKVLWMDEISTGLDSLTTFQVVNSLKNYIHVLGGTAVISLLQPAPETYNLFDDIILLSEGQIVYQGPREHVLEFFESIGFKCPDRKGVADFLQEVTSKKDQRQYWAGADERYRYITVKDFSEKFKSFHVGRKLESEIMSPYDKAKSHPAALTTKQYGARKKELLKACISRELLLMKRNKSVYIFKAFQLIMMPFIGMTIFPRTEMHRSTVRDGGIFIGVLFFYIITVLFSSYPELSMTIVNLPVFYKQRDLLFYPAWAYSIPSWILKIPIAFFEIALWLFPAYYVIGFDPNVGRVFKQFLIFLLMKQMASAYFRFMAAMTRNMMAGTLVSIIITIIFFVSGGFVLSRDDVKTWWKWTYWVSPLMYVQNAAAVNEMLGKSWRHVLPDSTESLGVLVLKYRGLFTEEYWYWVGVGALIGFTLLFNLLIVLSLTYLNPLEKQNTAMTDGSLSNEKDQSLGDTHEMRRARTTSSNRNKKMKGMILPFEKYAITFEDIKYSVDMPRAMKKQGVSEDRLQLLKGASGSFRPGVLTALMGVSGAGKTTLLDVLAGRKTGGDIEGNITISGYPKKQETFARISGYCEQNDIHSPNVTVFESLLYSAWLRLPPEADHQTRKMFVEEVMELVELNSLRGALVGLPEVSGLSTEQRKRLTIAVELVANPSIIFMDEPTSGLDARAAAIVMRAVRNTVDTGRTVVCTIHQPSIDIFEAFDELFLLKVGGEEIYVGPLGQDSRHVISYFEAVEGVRKIKDGYNPATWMLEVTTSAQEVALGVNFHQVYRNSVQYRRNIALIKDLSSPSPGSKELCFPTKYSQPFFGQCMACLWKQNWSYWRNPWYTAVKLIFTAVLSLLLGAVFWDLASKRETQQDMFNIIGCIYMGVWYLSYINATTIQAVVSVERAVFYREKAAGMYSAFPYALAQVAIEVPYVVAQTLVHTLVIYPMIGYECTSVKIFWFVFFTFITFLYSTFCGMACIAVTPSLQISGILTSAFAGIWSLFNGYIVPRPRIPVWWRWNYWSCPISFSLYGLVASQFGDMNDVLDSNETVRDFLRSYYGYDRDFIGEVAFTLVGFALLFGLLFAFSVKMLNFQRR